MSSSLWDTYLGPHFDLTRDINVAEVSQQACPIYTAQNSVDVSPRDEDEIWGPDGASRIMST